MNVVFVDAGQEWDLTVRVRQPTATVGDLLAALTPSGRDLTTAALLVGDRRVVGLDALLSAAGVCEGTTLRVLTDPRALRTGVERAGRVHLEVVAGSTPGGATRSRSARSRSAARLRARLRSRRPPCRAVMPRSP